MTRRLSAVAMIAGIALSGSTLVALSARPGFGQRNPPPHNVTSGKYYKNIKVLKSLPADQLIPIMRKIDDSLGVKCDFCHVIENGPNGQHTGFEKDTKPEKNVARQMILMTGDLNKRFKVVKNKVTCFTCHHGKAEPENDAPVPAPSGQ